MFIFFSSCSRRAACASAARRVLVYATVRYATTSSGVDHSGGEGETNGGIRGPLQHAAIVLFVANLHTLGKLVHQKTQTCSRAFRNNDTSQPPMMAISLVQVLGLI